MAFCKWSDVRLPSEPEWERAARGRNGRIYPWGNNAPDQNLCNFKMNIKGTTPVDNFPQGATSEGVLDMAGNVWEWNSTKYKVYPYDANDGREDLKSEDSRVLRGGSWLDFPENVRGASRFKLGARLRNLSVGFRVVALVTSSS